VPLAASKFFKHHDHNTHKRPLKAVEIFNKGYEKVQQKYQLLLDGVVENPKIIVSLAIAAFCISMSLIPFLGNEFFPVTANKQFFIRMRAETGTRIELTNELSAHVSATIQKAFPKDNVKVILANIGVISSWAAAYSPNSASHDALLEIELADDSAINADVAILKLRPLLNQLYPGTQFSFSLIDPVSSALNYGALNPIDLRIVTTAGLEKGQEVAKDILFKVKSVAGIQDAFIEQKLDYPSIHIDVNREKSAYVGLAADDVIKNVVTALNSSVLFSPNFWDDPVSGNNYFIGAMYRESAIDSLQTIANIPLKSPKQNLSNEAILLRNVATLSQGTVPVEISHYNIKRTFDVYANVSGRDIGSVASDIDHILEQIKLPHGVSAQWGGSIASMRSSFGSMGVGLILALVLIFLLMVAQLKSFIDPLLILITIPMGFIGVVWMLFHYC